MNKESLTKAIHAIGFCCDDLQTCLAKASPLEARILVREIDEATKLRNRLEGLYSDMFGEMP